eukprot:1150999-Pelagomonas_calceolata.AAC.2
MPGADTAGYAKSLPQQCFCHDSGSSIGKTVRPGVGFTSHTALSHRGRCVQDDGVLNCLQFEHE